MDSTKTECYLCRTPEATLIMDEPTRDRIVECPYCINRYKIPRDEFKFFFETEGKLDNDDKEELYKRVHDKIIVISSELIKEVTGKEPGGTILT